MIIHFRETVCFVGYRERGISWFLWRGPFSTGSYGVTCSSHSRGKQPSNVHIWQPTTGADILQPVTEPDLFVSPLSSRYKQKTSLKLRPFIFSLREQNFDPTSLRQDGEPNLRSFSAVHHADTYRDSQFTSNKCSAYRAC